MKVRHFSAEAHDAATNMAIDQVLVKTAAESGQHALRFYGWSQPTLSIGYFQNRADGEAYQSRYAVSDRIRRSTGGGAIVHHHDLTYCIAVATAGRTAADRDHLYGQTHAAFIETLSHLGVIAVTHRQHGVAALTTDSNPFLCFERRADEDLILNDYKVLGSAQRRIRGGLLQHGSLLLAASPHAGNLPGVHELSGVTLDPASLASRCSEQLTQRFGWELESSELTDPEAREVESLRQERFAASSWWDQR